jgi:hypothetical protein
VLRRLRRGQYSGRVVKNASPSSARLNARSEAAGQASEFPRELGPGQGRFGSGRLLGSIELSVEGEGELQLAAAADMEQIATHVSNSHNVCNSC